MPGEPPCVRRRHDCRGVARRIKLWEAQVFRQKKDYIGESDKHFYFSSTRTQQQEREKKIV
ncbi:hypothetical protein E2C01_027736 [Portunus trituberculatus]|uniref:Uncharacterized protein n=1 Tax=Portunus trituberculatus TaxID=210409 RepID=A0A5B7EIX1_PORTR|nr:hypothetical protein [Portunus trituberculatus]